jgi:hypothetical protein
MIYTQGIPRQGKSAPTHAKVDFKFSMLPDEIARRPDLSQGAKNLFALILSFSRLKGGACWLSNESLAERTGLCEKQVKRLLVSLEGLGLIRREMVSARRREIRVTWGSEMSLDTHPGTPGGTFGPRLSVHAGTSNPTQESRGEIKIGIYAPLPEPRDEDAPIPQAEVGAMIRGISRRSQ